MTSSLPSFSTADSYQNKLQYLATANPFFGRLIVDRESGDVFQTDILQAFWEDIKGTFGYRNWTNRSLVELKIIELAAEGRRFSLSSKDYLWITMIAMRALGNDFAAKGHEELTALIGQKVGAQPETAENITALIKHFIERSQKDLKLFNVQLPKIEQVFVRAIPPPVIAATKVDEAPLAAPDVEDKIIVETIVQPAITEINPVITRETTDIQPNASWMTVSNVAFLTLSAAAASVAIYYLWQSLATTSHVPQKLFCLREEKPLSNITDLICNAVDLKYNFPPSSTSNVISILTVPPKSKLQTNYNGLTSHANYSSLLGQKLTLNYPTSKYNAKQSLLPWILAPFVLSAAATIGRMAICFFKSKTSSATFESGMSHVACKPMPASKQSAITMYKLADVTDPQELLLLFISNLDIIKERLVSMSEKMDEIQRNLEAYSAVFSTLSDSK